MVNEFLFFTLAVLVLVATPGPATVLLAATSASYGRSAGFSLMAGLITSMLGVILFTSTGLIALVLTWPLVSRAATALAVAYMLWLAGRIATAPVLSHAQDTGRPPSFQTGFVLNFLNPKAYTAIAAPFSSFVLVPQQPLVDCTRLFARDAPDYTVNLISSTHSVNLRTLLSIRLSPSGHLGFGVLRFPLLRFGLGGYLWRCVGITVAAHKQ